MTRPARVGLIGCGSIGRAHAEAAVGCPGAVLAAVADVRVDAAAAIAALTGSTVLSPAALADPDRFDVVVVASPPASHAEVVEPLLRAGVPVICEKPLEVDLAAAAKLVAVAEETGTPLTTATKFRFVEDVAHARELARGGALGELIKAEVSFSGRVDMSGRWNSDPRISGGGVLIDNGPHGLDLIRHVAGPITELLAVTGPAGQPVGVEDTAVLLARTRAGVLAEVDLTWSFHRPSTPYLSLYGTAGAVEVGWRGGHAVTIDQPDGYDFGDGYQKLGALRANLRAVLDALAVGAPLPVSTSDALATVAAVEAGYLSLLGRAWIPVVEIQ